MSAFRGHPVPRFLGFLLLLRSNNPLYITQRVLASMVTWSETQLAQASKNHLLQSLARGADIDEKGFSASMIVRVILSAGSKLIFSVLFQIDHVPEGKEERGTRLDLQ